MGRMGRMRRPPQFLPPLGSFGALIDSYGKLSGRDLCGNGLTAGHIRTINLKVDHHRAGEVIPVGDDTPYGISVRIVRNLHGEHVER